MEQRRLRSEEQKSQRRKDGSGKGRSLRSHSLPSGKETSSIVDRLLGRIKGGFSSHSSRATPADEDGTDGGPPGSPTLGRAAGAPNGDPKDRGLQKFVSTFFFVARL